MAKGRILLAHANIDCQKIYGSVLAYEGYEVDLASDVESALELMATSHYDALVADLYLPSDEDECLLRRARQSSFAEHLPIMVLTGWATEFHRRLALSERADQFLGLPIRPRELVAAVRDVLGQEQHASPAKPVAKHHDQPVANGI
jgi:DNA-binding response OmpR family regulator